MHDVSALGAAYAGKMLEYSPICGKTFADKVLLVHGAADLTAPLTSGADAVAAVHAAAPDVVFTRVDVEGGHLDSRDAGHARREGAVPGLGRRSCGGRGGGDGVTADCCRTDVRHASLPGSARRRRSGRRAPRPRARRHVDGREPPPFRRGVRRRHRHLQEPAVAVHGRRVRRRLLAARAAQFEPRVRPHAPRSASARSAPSRRPADPRPRPNYRRRRSCRSARRPQIP